MSNLTPIAIVGSNAEINAQLLSALAVYFEVKIFTDTSLALDILQQEPHYALIVDNNVKPTGGLPFLESAKKIPGVMAIPCILLVDKHSEKLVTESDFGIDFDYLVNPINRKELLTKVSEGVNASVETSWEQLPDGQRRVLTETVGIFRDTFNVMRDGQPIPVHEIEKSCSPLVEAIENDQVTGLLNTVQQHDDYTYVHSLRVAIYLSLLGHAVGMKGDELMTLSSGGLMHDLGKGLVPQEVLNKPAKLDEAEFNIMKTHVDFTKEIFGKSHDITVGVEIIALQHHEKLDGSGYPLGLKGKELNTLARMGSIVDIYSALTDRRVYKPAMPPEKALGIMGEMKNGLDMALLDTFKEFLMDATNQPEG
jgi:HD-GYP domain-containing protein (c-di-GMP phosphodiesterase class II)